MQQFQISIALNLTSEPFLPFVFPSCILVYRWWAVKFWPFLYRYCNFQPAPWAHIVPLFGILKSHDETFIWVAGCSTPSSGNVRTCESRRSWPLKVSLLSQKIFVYLLTPIGRMSGGARVGRRTPPCTARIFKLAPSYLHTDDSYNCDNGTKGRRIKKKEIKKGWWSGSAQQRDCGGSTWNMQ